MDNPATPSSQRYAPPSAEVADVTTSGESVLAGRGARLGAVIIDFLALMVVFFVISLITPLNIFKPDVDPTFGKLVLLTLVSMAVFLVVQGWPLLQRSQTIGKMALGLRIVRPDGSAASPGRVLGLRYLLPYLLTPFTVVMTVYALVDCLMIFRANRRCLHDLIADTIVVKA